MRILLVFDVVVEVGLMVLDLDRSEMAGRRCSPWLVSYFKARD